METTCRDTAKQLHARTIKLLKATGFVNLDEVIDCVENEPWRLGNAREEAEELVADLLTFLDDR